MGNNVVNILQQPWHQMDCDQKELQYIKLRHIQR